MKASEIILSTLLAAVTGSYTWGMRGTILGGEKGAMLPGAALGLIIAFASGSEILGSSYYLLSAVGAAAMFFGGAQTYGQTIGMSYDRENKKRRIKGRVGLTVKGATWFGIFGGLIAMSFATMAGRYSVLQICIFVIFLPITKWLGFLCLNFPQKPKEGKFPKLYFSEGRFETWGGLVFVNLWIILFALFTGEFFAVIMTLAGLVSGGVGFFTGNLLQTATPKDGINGKWLLGRFQKAGYVGSWKLMEFTLGAVGGMGTTLCFCLCRDRFVSRYISEIQISNGIWSPLSQNTSTILTYVFLAVLLIYVVRFILPQPKPYIPEITARLNSGEISKPRFDELMETATDKKPSKLLKIIGQSDEIIVWPVYCYLPILLSLLCNAFASQLISFFVIFWLLAEEIMFTECYKNEFKHINIVKCVLGGLAIIVLALQLFIKPDLPAIAAWIMYCLSYEAVQAYNVFAPDKLKALKISEGTLIKGLLSSKSNLTVRGYSAICIIFMLITGIIIFS